MQIINGDFVKNRCIIPLKLFCLICRFFSVRSFPSNKHFEQNKLISNVYKCVFVYDACLYYFSLSVEQYQCYNW